MENPIEYIPKEINSYHVFWFIEPFYLLPAMFFQLYGIPNCSVFKSKWVPVAHHIILTSESFKWAQILSMILKEEIEKFSKIATNRDPTFFMLGYVMDVFCSTSTFPILGWNW